MGGGWAGENTQLNVCSCISQTLSHTRTHTGKRLQMGHSCGVFEFLQGGNTAMTFHQRCYMSKRDCVSVRPDSSLEGNHEELDNSVSNSNECLRLPNDYLSTFERYDWACL